MPSVIASAARSLPRPWVTWRPKKTVASLLQPFSPRRLISSTAGDLRVFVDEEQLKAVETQMAERGYLEGKQMAQAFNMLRSNDLIWSYVVNN